MKKITLADTAAELLLDADEQFAPGLTGIPEYRDAFLAVCGDLDTVMDACEASEFDISVDDETTDITVAFLCMSLEAWPDPEPLLRAVRTAADVTFSQKGEDTLEVKFVFPGIWGYAE